jgi:hypothetical protein
MKFDYYEHRSKTLTSEIEKEIRFLENHPSSESVTDYLKYLRKRIGIDEEDKPHAYTPMKLINMVPEDYFKDMDNKAYSRPWNKLAVFHKKLKLTSFLDNLEYPSIEPQKAARNRNRISDILLGVLDDRTSCTGVLTVTYDPDIQQITNVKCLVYDPKRKLYIIDWNN